MDFDVAVVLENLPELIFLNELENELRKIQKLRVKKGNKRIWRLNKKTGRKIFACEEHRIKHQGCTCYNFTN